MPGSSPKAHIDVFKSGTSEKIGSITLKRSTTGAQLKRELAEKFLKVEIGGGGIGDDTRIGTISRDDFDVSLALRAGAHGGRRKTRRGSRKHRTRTRRHR